MNYAAALYLLYYVQEQGLLRELYRKLRAARAKDPSGYERLKAVLGEPDMAAVEQQVREAMRAAAARAAEGPWPEVRPLHDATYAGAVAGKEGAA